MTKHVTKNLFEAVFVTSRDLIDIMANYAASH